MDVIKVEEVWDAIGVTAERIITGLDIGLIEELIANSTFALLNRLIYNNILKKSLREMFKEDVRSVFTTSFVDKIKLLTSRNHVSRCVYLTLLQLLVDVLDCRNYQLTNTSTVVLNQLRAESKLQIQKSKDKYFPVLLDCLLNNSSHSCNSLPYQTCLEKTEYTHIDMLEQMISNETS